MVRLDCIDNLFALAIAFRDIDTDADVRAFDLGGHRLTDIVQEPRALRHRAVKPHFVGERPGKERYLHRVAQDVLPVTRAVLESAEQTNQLGVEPVDTCFKDCFFARLLHRGLYLAACLVHHLLDAGRVDTAVGNQFLEGKPRDFTADGVEAGDRDDLGRVVDDEFHPGQRLDRADVASLTPDDASLHVLARERDHGDGGLAHMVGGATLNGKGKDLFRLFVRVLFELLLKFGELLRGLVLDFRGLAGEEFVLRLFRAHAGDTFQYRCLFFEFRLEFLTTGVCRRNLLGEGRFFLFERLDLTVDRFLFLRQAVFLVRDFAAAILELCLRLVFLTDNFFFGFEQRLFLARLRRLHRLVDDLHRLRLGRADFRFGNLTPPQVPEPQPDKSRPDRDEQNKIPLHKTGSSFTVCIRKPPQW